VTDLRDCSRSRTAIVNVLSTSDFLFWRKDIVSLFILDFRPMRANQRVLQKILDLLFLTQVIYR
jgi:hypothetical protein